MQFQIRKGLQNFNKLVCLTEFIIICHLVIGLKNVKLTRYILMKEWSELNKTIQLQIKKTSFHQV